MPIKKSDLKRIFVRVSGRTIDLETASDRLFRVWLVEKFNLGLVQRFFEKANLKKELELFKDLKEKWPLTLRVKVIDFIEEEHGWTPVMVPKD